MDLQRFVDASDTTHERALAELRAGRKTSHWMWWEFPQLLLGSSPTSVQFAVSGPDEARAYLAHPVLGARLRENCEALLAGSSDDAQDVFGRVLEKFFAGRTDTATLRLLED